MHKARPAFLLRVALDAHEVKEIGSIKCATRLCKWAEPEGALRWIANRLPVPLRHQVIPRSTGWSMATHSAFEAVAHVDIMSCLDGASIDKSRTMQFSGKWEGRGREVAVKVMLRNCGNRKETERREPETFGG